jgi:hypothetical protein
LERDTSVALVLPIKIVDDDGEHFIDILHGSALDVVPIFLVDPPRGKMVTSLWEGENDIKCHGRSFLFG